ncbi:hypothetical protein PFISCL1PPCAC_3748, partial [Pristionchus fissidentatus]
RCRRHKNERRLSNKEIAELAYPGNVNAEQKMMRIIERLKEDNYSMRNHTVSAFVKKMKLMGSDVDQVEISSIDELPDIPDLTVIETGQNVEALMKKSAEIGGHGVSLVLLFNSTSPPKNTIQIHTMDGSIKNFNNGFTHAIGGIHPCHRRERANGWWKKEFGKRLPRERLSCRRSCPTLP